VLSDNAGGACAGVLHLISQGHRRIGYIGDDPGIYTAALRHRGYLDALAQAGLAARDAWTAMAAPDAAGITGALARMLAGPDPVTALFCGNNRVTVLALRALAATGRRLALVGFDDLELADLLTPGISVVAQDPAEMGRIAAELLFRRLAGEGGQARRIELATRLIARGSGEIPPERLG
jgi:LacI family transcriptional regulator